MKSCWSKSVFRLSCVEAAEYCSPPPFARARLVNASMCRASSIICVERKKTTSANCGLIRGTNFAGT